MAKDSYRERKEALTAAVQDYAYHGAILTALSKEGQLPLLITLSDLRESDTLEDFIVTFFLDDNPDNWPTPYYTVPFATEDAAWDFAHRYEKILRPSQPPTMDVFRDGARVAQVRRLG